MKAENKFSELQTMSFAVFLQTQVSLGLSKLMLWIAVGPKANIGGGNGEVSKKKEVGGRLGKGAWQTVGRAEELGGRGDG